MNIGIVGLGLIGGSFAKAIKLNTDHTVFGVDTNTTSLEKAVQAGDVDRVLESDEDFAQLDILFLALYPVDAVEFVRQNIKRLSRGSIIMDLCGVKRYVCKEIHPLIKHTGVTFIGAHPMAGREFSGYDYATAELFVSASMILTPYPGADYEKIEMVSGFFTSIGFGHIEITTDTHHDEMIAYTSQLAHILSSAYIQNPIAESYKNFSAGSFKDLTRVARLNEVMWSELFSYNKDILVDQIGVIIDNLQDFRTAIQNDDRKQLQQMLKNGRLMKEKLD